MSPVEVTYLDVHASGALEDWGVAVSAVIDDADPSARAKDPDGFAKRPGAFFAARDVAQGQVTEHHVERLGRKGKVPCISIDQLDPLADALDLRVALGGCPAIPRLVTQTPDIGSGCTASGEAVGCRDEDGTATATDVEYELVASQVEFIEQLFPDRQLARTGAVEVARSDAQHGYGPYLRQRADKALVLSLRPPRTSHKTGFGKEEDRNAAVPSVDTVPGLISHHLTECARPSRATARRAALDAVATSRTIESESSAALV